MNTNTAPFVFTVGEKVLADLNGWRLGTVTKVTPKTVTVIGQYPSTFGGLKSVTTVFNTEYLDQSPLPQRYAGRRSFMVWPNGVDDETMLVALKARGTYLNLTTEALKRIRDMAVEADNRVAIVEKSLRATADAKQAAFNGAVDDLKLERWMTSALENETGFVTALVEEYQRVAKAVNEYREAGLEPYKVATSTNSTYWNIGEAFESLGRVRQARERMLEVFGNPSTPVTLARLLNLQGSLRNDPWRMKALIDAKVAAAN